MKRTIVLLVLCLVGLGFMAGAQGCTPADIQAMRDTSESTQKFLAAKEAELAALVESYEAMPAGPEKDKKIAEAEDLQEQLVTIQDVQAKLDKALAGAQNEWDIADGIISGAIPYLPPIGVLIASTIVAFGRAKKANQAAADAAQATSEIVTSVDAAKAVVPEASLPAFKAELSKAQSASTKKVVAIARAK